MPASRRRRGAQQIICESPHFLDAYHLKCTVISRLKTTSNMFVAFCFACIADVFLCTRVPRSHGWSDKTWVVDRYATGRFIAAAAMRSSVEHLGGGASKETPFAIMHTRGLFVRIGR
jgi:hypothetical protein